jgi:regulatory protein YycI of two-component signal transduction system YycFG
MDKKEIHHHHIITLRSLFILVFIFMAIISILIVLGFNQVHNDIQKLEEKITENQCTQEVIHHIPVQTDSNTSNTRASIIKKAKSLSETETEQAKQFCLEVKDLELKDECLRIIAYQTQDKEICTLIEYTVKKDACYMEFAMKFDYSVCPLIENEYLKRSCEALKVRPVPE